MDTSESYDQTQQHDQAMQISQIQPQQQIMFPTSFPSNGFIPQQQQQQQPLQEQQIHEAVMIGPQLQSTAIPLPPPPPSQGTISTTAAQQPATTTSTEFDIDSCLLQQFSCLGTTDHDDLINSFQSLMNNQMNKDSARFFLEMSNWNLQTAVGCYLDFCNFQTLPSMKILEQSRASEWKQAWRLQNDGNEDWPSGCYLMSPSQKRRIEVPTIRPGETCDIVADIPPTQPAVMWRLCTPNGWYFGETIWMIPPGNCDTAAELTERMSQLRTSTSINPDCFPQVNVVIMANME